MKVVFMGTASFAVPTLEVMAPHICMVVTQPDKPSGRKLQLHPSPVKQRALELGLRVEAPIKSRNPEFVEQVRNLEADVILVGAYGQILSTHLLNAAKRGSINLHGSILPKYRGAAPIQRAILNGESETGVTLMQMNEGMDTGDIIDIARTPIGPDETYGELQDRLAVIAAKLSSDWISKIVSGQYPRVPQNHDEATMAPKVQKEEARLSFKRSAIDEYNRFRAFTPKPGAFLETRFGALKITKAGFSNVEVSCGVVVATAPELVIGFTGGSLIIHELHPAGKKPVSGREYANGIRLRAGDFVGLDG